MYYLWRNTLDPSGGEVACATLSFYDAQGDRLKTLRLARMPEQKKATLKSVLAAEVKAVLARRPALTLVKLAGGAPDGRSLAGQQPTFGLIQKAAVPGRCLR